MSLGRAREAAARGDWEEAYDVLMKADVDGLAGPADLSLLGEVAYAAGHLDVTIEAWERAYALFVDAGDKDAAAGAAVRVAMHLLFDTALMAPVRGWLARAERLLDGQRETPANAWLAVVRTYERMLTGDLPGARPWARRAIELGSEHDPAACALGQVAEARLLILGGDVEQGLALLDEVGVATVAGDLDPLSTGVVYCELVCALQGLAQYDVAEEWTEAMERWCKTNAIGSLHGRCRVHRAEILRLRGACNEAERVALGACDELRPYLRREMGWPLTELGRIRLRTGDIEGAEEALLAADRVGWDPQPGLALVRLAQGDLAAAAASIRDALERPMRVPSKERPPDTDLQRAPLLEAQVEIEIAAGNLGRARAAGDELQRVGARFKSKALVAGATLARGRVQLAEGHAAEAERCCSDAARLWNQIGAPYEVARARMVLAEALRAGGSEDQAVLERQAAATILERIEVAVNPTTHANVFRREDDWRERDHAEDECGGRHEDGPQPRLRGRDRGVDGRHSVLLALARELDDQDRVLRREADQHHHADLREDVVVEAAQVHAEHRGEQAHRHDEDHGERQREALVERRQENEHEHDAEHERERAGVARSLLLVGDVGPFEVHAGGQRVARDALHRGDRLARRVAGRGVALDVRGRIEVVAQHAVRRRRGLAASRPH